MNRLVNEIKVKAAKAAEEIMNTTFGSAVRDELIGHPRPVEFLKWLPWEHLLPVDENISQEEFTRMNEELDPHGCVGRVTLAMWLLEKHFPWAAFQVGEVVVDDLAERMKVMIKNQTDSQIRQEMASELLMYEDPHAILIVDGVQFDPLVRLAPGLKHPYVKVCGEAPWQVITAFLLNGRALEEGDLIARDILLQMAEIFCPTRNIAQSRLACRVGLGDCATKDFEKFLADGHNARAEYQMLQIFGDQRIFDHYPQEVVDILDQEMEAEMRKVVEGGIYGS